MRTINTCNGKIKIFGVLAVFLFLTGVVSGYGIEGGGICNCNSCGDCTNALNDNTNCANKVKLTANIWDYAGYCINNPANFNNKIFDCQGHTIDGDGSGTGHGIYLNNKDDDTIKNCVITDFCFGIFLQYSSDNTLTSNTVNSNTHHGICLQSSSNYNI